MRLGFNLTGSSCTTIFRAWRCGESTRFTSISCSESLDGTEDKELGLSDNISSLKGTYQGFSFFIANSFYMSDFMYLLRTQIIFHNVH